MLSLTIKINWLNDKLNIFLPIENPGIGKYNEWQFFNIMPNDSENNGPLEEQRAICRAREKICLSVFGQIALLTNIFYLFHTAFNVWYSNPTVKALNCISAFWQLAALILTTIQIWIKPSSCGCYVYILLLTISTIIQSVGLQIQYDANPHYRQEVPEHLLLLRNHEKLWEIIGVLCLVLPFMAFFSLMDRYKDAQTRLRVAITSLVVYPLAAGVQASSIIAIYVQHQPANPFKFSYWIISSISLALTLASGFILLLGYKSSKSLPSLVISNVTFVASFSLAIYNYCNAFRSNNEHHNYRVQDLAAFQLFGHFVPAVLQYSFILFNWTIK